MLADNSENTTDNCLGTGDNVGGHFTYCCNHCDEDFVFSFWQGLWHRGGDKKVPQYVIS